MTTFSVNLGSSFTLTVTFTSATGGSGNFNSVAWSFIPVVDDPTQPGGNINIAPAAPPSSPTNTTTASITGVYPGTVQITATPDTNPDAAVTGIINIIDTSSTPVTGTLH